MNGDRIFHSWSLKKEKGERSTDLANLDPDFAVTERENEGKLPYFILGLMFLVLVLLDFPGQGILGNVLKGLFLGAGIACFLVAILIRKKERVTIVHLKDGSVFALIRHRWVGAEERETFLSSLEKGIREAEAGKRR